LASIDTFGGSPTGQGVDPLTIRSCERLRDPSVSDNRPGVIDVVVPNPGAGFQRIDDLAVAGVDADVGGIGPVVVEDEISRLKLIPTDRKTLPELLGSGAIQCLGTLAYDARVRPEQS
jgi:hypothetical protein